MLQAVGRTPYGKKIAADKTGVAVTKLLFDDSPGAELDGGYSGDIGKTIHPHTTLGESIGMAAEIAHGSCTDVPPSKK